MTGTRPYSSLSIPATPKGMTLLEVAVAIAISVAFTTALSYSAISLIRSAHQTERYSEAHDEAFHLVNLISDMISQNNGLGINTFTLLDTDVSDNYIDIVVPRTDHFGVVAGMKVSDTKYQTAIADPMLSSRLFAILEATNTNRQFKNIRKYAGYTEFNNSTGLIGSLDLSNDLETGVAMDDTMQEVHLSAAEIIRLKVDATGLLLARLEKSSDSFNDESFTLVSPSVKTLPDITKVTGQNQLQIKVVTTFKDRDGDEQTVEAMNIINVYNES